MTFIDILRTVLRRVSLALAAVAVVVIAGRMLTITYYVVMRFAFAAPTDWADPINAAGVLGSTMLALPYLYVRRQHIALDTVARPMPRTARRTDGLATAGPTGPAVLTPS